MLLPEQCKRAARAGVKAILGSVLASGERQEVPTSQIFCRKLAAYTIAPAGRGPDQLPCESVTRCRTMPLVMCGTVIHMASHGLVLRVPGGNRHSRLSIAAKYLSKAASAIATIATDLPPSCPASPYLASPHPVRFSYMHETVSGHFCLHPAPHPLHI